MGNCNWGGETYRTILAKTSLGGLEKWDLSGLCPFHLRKMTGMDKRGGKTYHRWGGPKPFLGEGFMVCFPLSWVFHPPLPLSEPPQPQIVKPWECKGHSQSNSQSSGPFSEQLGGKPRKGSHFSLGAFVLFKNNWGSPREPDLCNQLERKRGSCHVEKAQELWLRYGPGLWRANCWPTRTHGISTKCEENIQKCQGISKHCPQALQNTIVWHLFDNLCRLGHCFCFCHPFQWEPKEAVANKCSAIAPSHP